METRADAPRYRLGVAARVVAAVGGGYGVAALVAIAGACALPMAPEEAATIATILAILAMPVAAMGCFWARSAARAWGGIVLSSAVLGAIAVAAGWWP